MTDDPNRRIGDYEVLGVLGSGGMGKVFKVRNVISDRIEAMKILLPDLAGRQELADRFLREIKLLASLDHPNIAQLRTALTLSNRLVMVMEYVEGTTLAVRLEQGPIRPDEAVGYVRQVLGALAYAHDRNVIHRDIKPANMMLTPGGKVKLMDFGIARASGDASMTVTGSTVGSLFYMSPEQVKGENIDARSDLYSLGVSLYEMVTGQRPFKADSDYSLMTAQLQERPKPPSELRPDLPGQLNGIILHSMAKEPAERFQSANEFRQALDMLSATMPAPVVASQSMPSAVPIGATAVMAGAAGMTPPAMDVPMAMPTQTAPVPSVMELSPKPGSGRGLYMTLGALTVLAVLVLAGLSFPRWLKTRASEQKHAADHSATDANSGTDTSGSGTSKPADLGTGAASGSSASSDSGKTPDAGAQPPTDARATAAPPTGGTTSVSGNPSGGGSSASGSSTVAGGSMPTTAKAKSPSGKKSAKTKATLTGDAGASTTPVSAGLKEKEDVGNSVSDSAPKTEATEPIEELEQDVDQTSSRAVAASDSLDSMRRQLSSQGLNLRGDISSSEEMMKVNLDKARRALQNQDTKSARRYLTMAQAQMEKIEKFLGH
jgi:serine/threonine-protein kinase